MHGLGIVACNVHDSNPFPLPCWPLLTLPLAIQMIWAELKQELHCWVTPWKTPLGIGTKVYKTNTPCIIQGAVYLCIPQVSTAYCLWCRFVKLALLWTVPTFFTSRETTGTGWLPDLIKFKDIQTDRLNETSDPLRFNLFGSISAGWSLVDIRWNMREILHPLVLTAPHF